jgi:hypothetical protein
MMEEKIHDIYQIVIRLPYFNHEVPVLYPKDGACYIPVIALCEMVGLNANSYIPRWRKLVLWANARKLSYCTINGWRRLAWCLHIGAVPLWCSCFDWSPLPPKRQEQLHLATGSWYDAPKKAYMEMLSNYRQTNGLLLTFLTTYESTDAKPSQLAIHLHQALYHCDLCVQLEELLVQGKDLIQRATDCAHQMLQEQAINPFIDAVKLDEDSQILEQLSLPLFPVFSQEISAQFYCYHSGINGY